MNNSELFKEVIEIYDNSLKQELEDLSILITRLIENIFNEKTNIDDNEYKLTHMNTGYLGKYYKVSSRVKTKLSLGDKLIKKNDLLDIKLNIDLEGEDFEKEVLTYFNRRYSDLIGIKILGDLKEDTLNILKLINDFQNDFIEEETSSKIIFTNLEEAESTMQSGLDIIKIDCIIETGEKSKKFELQIKSQLMSAWGDMEHQHFYKNYRFSMVRQSQQPIMNDIGAILEKTDQLLLSVRNSESSYLEHRQLWDFKDIIQTKYSYTVNQLIGLNVDNHFNELSTTLFKVVQKNQIDIEKIELTKEMFEFVSQNRLDITNLTHETALSLLRFKEIDFKFQILEYILLSWYHLEGNEVNNHSSYEEFLLWIIDIIIFNIKDYYVIEEDADEIKLDLLLKEFILYTKDFNLLLKYDELYDLVDFYRTTKEVHSELIEDEEDVLDVEILYIINFIFLRITINNEVLDDIQYEIRDIDSYVLQRYFDKFNDEIIGTQREHYKEISDKIHIFLEENRGGYA